MSDEVCTLDGCERPLNRDGLCFKHKIQTIRSSTEGLKREREGRDVTGGQGTRKYVEDMYAQKRRQGLPDPIPENKASARFAPRRKLSEGGVI